MAKEDSGASQEAAPEPELAPYVLESARSSRSKCRTCRRKIEKGKLRLGILLGIGELIEVPGGPNDLPQIG